MSAFKVDRMQRNNYCRPGRGADTCRYLVCGAEGFECAKHQPTLAEQINRQVEAGTFTATGDNCDGIGGANVH